MSELQLAPDRLTNIELPITQESVSAPKPDTLPFCCFGAKIGRIGVIRPYAQPLLIENIGQIGLFWDSNCPFYMISRSSIVLIYCFFCNFASVIEIRRLNIMVCYMSPVCLHSFTTKLFLL